MIRVDVDIAIRVKAPFITKSSAPGPYGLDCVHARTPDGRLYIPGTHVTGKLRQAWEELRSIIDDTGTDAVPTNDGIQELLGRQLTDGDFVPQSKQLFFSDFVCDQDSSKGFRHRIEIEDERNAARKGSLLTIESPFPSGQTAVFKGLLIFETIDNAQAARILSQVKCGLQWVSQIGAYRTVGFGRVVGIQFGKAMTKQIGRPKRQWENASSLDLIIAPQAPFCIAGRPSADNIFESLEEIPGGVIKGCLAHKINRLLGRKSAKPITDEDNPGHFAKLQRYFHHIRVTHAFPSANCFVRPVRPPYSMVRAGGLFDVAVMEAPCLINGQAPEFQIDWKDDTSEKKHFGWPRLNKELRVRTAIDSETLRSAENQLFAYEMIIPEERSWLARVQLDEEKIPPEDRDAVLNDLSALLESGLLGMGKGKTSARVSVNPSGTLVDARQIDRLDHPLSEDCLWVITLQTPMLLVSPDYLKESDDVREALFKGYQDAWAGICPALTLMRFFARQSLSGGLYQHGRFRKTKTARYRPWLLTDAGSVFVFTSTDRAQAKERVQTWLKQGMPIPDATLAAYGLTPTEDLWRHCPFIPQNGYGEIAVNLEVHEANQPRQGQYTVIETPEEA